MTAGQEQSAVEIAVNLLAIAGFLTLIACARFRNRGPM